MCNECKNSNVRAAYEYISQVHDDVLGQMDKTAERANKMLLSVALVFGALSFGATKLVRVAQHPERIDCLFGASALIGLLGALALAVAFAAALTCGRIKTVTVPATDVLCKRLRQSAFVDIEHSRVLRLLAMGVHTAIEANANRQNERENWSGLLDWTPQVGFALTAIFVILTFGQHMALPAESKCPPSLTNDIPLTQIGESPMGDEEKKPQEGAKPTAEDTANEQNPQEIVDDIERDMRENPRHIRGSKVLDEKRGEGATG